MKKIAIFVEGQTEQIFIAELLKQLCTAGKVYIETHRLEGKFRPIKINARNAGVDSEYFFVIYDCGNDERVKTDILENYTTLVKQQFVFVIGLRDVYSPGKSKTIDSAKLKAMLNSGLPHDLPIQIFLAVQEIEAWFLAEENHYESISSSLSLNTINSITGIDIQTGSTESLVHPSIILDKIYQVAGSKYTKNKYVVQRTVYSIDYENLYLNVRNRNNSLNELLTCLDGLIP